MSVGRHLITEFVSDIWRLVVGRAAEPTAQVPASAPDWVFARVQITGAWRGTVTVAAGPELVRSLAAAVFATPPERVTDAHRTDAVGELASMIAGNLKAVLPPPCYQSPPAVATGDGSEGGEVSRRRVLRGGFTDPAGVFVVTVAETHKPEGRRRHPERPSNINPLSDCETSGRYPQVLAEDYVVTTPSPVARPATDADPLR